jgi:hypothetical protein
MAKLEELLTDPFDGLTKNEFKKACDNIAKTFFCNYCINCNGTKFYFAEIEFYYWQKNKWNENWNRVTYPRICEAGSLFFHLSGIDICFNSIYDEEELDKEAKFGGILIRAIRDKDNIITAGPWNCMLKILNACRGGSMPEIEELKQPCNDEKVIKETYRSLGKEDQREEKEMSEKESLNLCFYDSSIHKDEWKNQAKIILKKSGELDKGSASIYKLDRFKLQE